MVRLMGDAMGHGLRLVLWSNGLGHRWWVTLVVLGYVWCGSGFRLPWLLWVMAFGLRLKMSFVMVC